MSSVFNQSPIPVLDVHRVALIVTVNEILWPRELSLYEHTKCVPKHDKCQVGKEFL